MSEMHVCDSSTVLYFSHGIDTTYATVQPSTAFEISYKNNFVIQNALLFPVRLRALEMVEEKEMESFLFKAICPSCAYYITSNYAWYQWNSPSEPFKRIRQSKGNWCGPSKKKKEKKNKENPNIGSFEGKK